MKRRPPEIPDLSAGARRMRHLSEEEHKLWESVAKQVKPLRKGRRLVRTHAAEVETPGVAPTVPSRPSSPVKIVAPPKPHAPPLAPIGRRERTRLSRGKQEI